MEGGDDKPPSRPERETVQLDPRELAADGSVSLRWALVQAALERATPWGIYALRLGALALLAECTRAMALPNAPKALLGRAQEIIDMLNAIGWE